jgi:hypothetical protein
LLAAWLFIKIQVRRCELGAGRSVVCRITVVARALVVVEGCGSGTAGWAVHPRAGLRALVGWHVRWDMARRALHVALLLLLLVVLWVMLLLVVLRSTVPWRMPLLLLLRWPAGAPGVLPMLSIIVAMAHKPSGRAQQRYENLGEQRPEDGGCGWQDAHRQRHQQNQWVVLHPRHRQQEHAHGHKDGDLQTVMQAGMDG